MMNVGELKDDRFRYCVECAHFVRFDSSSISYVFAENCRRPIPNEDRYMLVTGRATKPLFRKAMDERLDETGCGRDAGYWEPIPAAAKRRFYSGWDGLDLLFLASLALIATSFATYCGILAWRIVNG